MLSLKKVVCLFVIFGLLAVSFAEAPSADAPGTPEAKEPMSDNESPQVKSPSTDSPQSKEPMSDTKSPEVKSPGTDSPQSKDNVERSFEFNFDADKIEARIRIRSDDFESEVRHEIRAGDSGAEFRVEFEQEAGDVENQLRMRLRLFQLIEYVPDSTPGYQNETIVNTYSNWNWGEGFVDTTPNSADSKVYTLKTKDNIFGLTLRVNRPADGSLMFQPEDVKFDIELDADAMRAAGWLNGTEVALKAALATRLETEKEHDDDSTQVENTISVGAPGVSEFGALYLNWINYIQCDVNKVSVVSSALREDDSQSDESDDDDSTARVVAFAFIDLNAKSNGACVWDPVVSATRAVSPGTPGTSGVPSGKSSGAASAVASLAVLATAAVALF